MRIVRPIAMSQELTRTSRALAPRERCYLVRVGAFSVLAEQVVCGEHGWHPEQLGYLVDFAEFRGAVVAVCIFPDEPAGELWAPEHIMRNFIHPAPARAAIVKRAGRLPGGGQPDQVRDRRECVRA